MENGLINIIIPVYNVSKYLSVCLESVLYQTYTKWIAIIVDDGSNDGSEKICDEFARKDARFYVIHQKNQGAAIAKNVGLDYVQGEYVTFLDSDDYVELDWLECALNAMNAYQADIVEYSFYKNFLNHVETMQVSDQCCNVIYSAEKYLSGYLDDWTCSLFWNKMFSSKIIKEIRFHQERRCIDDEFFTYKVMSEANRIVRIKNVLYHYRQRASSAVSNNAHQKQIVLDALDILAERYKWIAKKFPSLRKIYLCHDVDIMFYFINNFKFNDKAICNFRKISKFYFFECLLHWTNYITTVNATKLLFVKKKKLISEKTQEKITEIEEYYT